MSYANKPNRPDSKDVAKLRKEYEDKARQFRETNEPASKAKLKDDKEKAFQKVVAQMDAERGVQIVETRKALAMLGRYKTDEQLAKEKAEAEAGKTQNLARESRI
jgi:hypothetical protein